MKKLILSFLALGATLAAMAQIKPTFVYDDGTIQSGYFEVTSGASGIYWSQGDAPTAYTIDNTQRNTGIAAPITMNSSNVTIPGRLCNVTVAGALGTNGSAFPAKGVSTAPGLAAPFVLTFGVSTVNGIATPNTIDISANPLLNLTYSKPATPASDYYIVGYSNALSDFVPINTTNLGFYNMSATSFGTTKIVGNITSGYGASGANPNNTPLRVTIQVVDASDKRIELNSTVGGAAYNWQKLGFTMPQAATTNAVFSVNLSNLAVLDYNTNTAYPNNPYVCENGTLGKNGCPAIKGAASSTAAGFDFKKVKQVLIFLSSGCAGKLEVATSLGICGYGVNYTCYDNTLTINGFSLGQLPPKSGYPGELKVRTVSGSTSFNINWLNTSTPPQQIAIARSNTSTGGWVVVRYLEKSDYSSIDTVAANYGSNTFYDGTVGGASFYKIGGVNNGLITWAPGFATVGFSSVGAPVTGATVSGLSIGEEYLGSNSFTVLPNPTSGSTIVKFDLVKAGNISYKVFNSFAQEVASSPASILSPGSHTSEFNLQGNLPGLYLVTIMVDGKPAKTTKLMLE